MKFGGSMQSVARQSPDRAMRSGRGWVAAARLIAIIIVALSAAAGVSSLLRGHWWPATPESSSSPLGELGKNPVPPSL
jgi:hypothetical protein